MRNLSKGILNNRTEVKFLQAWLNQFEGTSLSVDGSYGPKTVDAVKLFQSRRGAMTCSGKADQSTLNQMGFRTTKNKNIVVLEIPFSKLSGANVLLENGKAFSCQKFAQQGYDIVWNGAHFNTKNRMVVQLVVKAGKVIQWGMGYLGIAYPNDWASTPMAACRNVDSVTGLAYDMQGGAPVLIRDYLRDAESISKFDRNLFNAKTRRNCTGLTDTSFLLFFSLTPMSFESVIAEGLYQKARTLCGNDCGGSQSLFMGGAYVLTTDGRAIPAAIGLKVK